MKKTIIAFTGKKGSGKSEACKFFESKLKCERINFKDSLIEEMKRVFPDTLARLKAVYTASSIDELFVAKLPITRALMQNFGTELRRAEDKNYWTKQWSKKILKSTSRYILTDDVRFLNEEEAVRKKDGFIIRMQRPTAKSKDQHLSETEMEGIKADYTVTADDLETLHIKLGEIAKKLMLL